MQTALRYPLWGSFITRVGTLIAARGQLIDLYLTRDLDLAVKQQRLQVDSVLVARDIVLGSIFYGIETMQTAPTRAHHAEHMLRSVLVGLGLPLAEADAIAFMPLPGWRRRSKGRSFRRSSLVLRSHLCLLAGNEIQGLNFRSGRRIPPVNATVWLNISAVVR